jgi:hypothetical protein
MYSYLYNVGFMGWGNITPLFNKLHSYWPLKDLIDINPNFYVVDVGKVSSDHDRACEAFYQLYGGQVDYGEEHSKSCGTDFSISCDIYVYIYNFSTTTTATTIMERTMHLYTNGLMARSFTVRPSLFQGRSSTSTLE